MNPFTTTQAESIASLGESRLIARIRTWLASSSPRAPFGIGDDCAVVPFGRSSQLLTVDPVIYGEHFDDAVHPRAVGAKLLKRNLSDIAAMGGVPRAAVVALALDSRVRIDWLRGFYCGLAAMSRRFRVPIVGGDIARHTGGIVATLTLVGQTGPRRIVTRSGARIGDYVYVTGVLGGSLPSGHHHRFQPRLEEGIWLGHRSEVRSMMDVSDGLAKDVHALAPPGAWPALQAKALPIRRGYQLKNALCDGEDYELLVAVDSKADPADFLRAWKRKFPKVRLSCIGRFLRRDDRTAGCIDLASFHGFEHLR